MSQPPNEHNNSNDQHEGQSSGEKAGLVATSPNSITTVNPNAVNPIPLPKGTRKKKGMGLFWPLVFLAVAGGGGGAYYTYHTLSGSQGQTKYENTPVGKKDLQLVIRERGTLEAKDNHDYKCEVKAGSRGNAKIKWLVENGTIVKEGDPLVEIDDSFLAEELEKKEIERQKAESDMIAAKQDVPTKEIAVTLAKEQLKQWVNGDFPQQLHDLEGQIQNSESAVLQQEDRTSWANRMVKKGYMTLNQAEAEQANLTGNKLNLQKYNEQLKVLKEFTDPVKRQTLGNAIKEAESNYAKAVATRNSALKVYSQQDKLYKDLQFQIEQCKITAKHSGIVVYAVPEQAARGMGGNQSIIAQGESVAAGQKILSIPDLTHMMVKVRIHEAYIHSLKTGLAARIRVDSLGDRELKGIVKYVASVPSPPDWMSPDVRVYDCTVEITDYLADAKLKPGLSAVCSISTDKKASNVIAVPIQAVLSPQEKGSASRVYVFNGVNAEPREVELGMSDGRYVEIKEGLNEGDQLILNARTIFENKEKKGPAAGKQGPPGAPSGAGKMAPGIGGMGGPETGAPPEKGSGRGKGKGKGNPFPGGEQ